MPPLATVPGTDSEDDTVSLQIDPASDVVPPERRSRLKAAIKTAFTTEEQADKEKKKRASKFFQKNVGLLTGGVIFCIHLCVPDEYKELFYINDRPYTLLPTDQHVTDILTPIARIADRHTNITDVNPDLLDLIACGQACFACGMEVRANMILKRYMDAQETKEAKLNNIKEEWKPFTYANNFEEKQFGTQFDG